MAIGTSCVRMSKKRLSFVRSGTYIKAAGVDPPEPNTPAHLCGDIHRLSLNVDLKFDSPLSTHPALYVNA